MTRVADAAARAAPDEGRPQGVARRLVAGLLPLLCAALPLRALVAAPAPVELVQDTTSRMLATLKAEEAEIQRDESRLYALIADIVLPHFDFDRMSMWTLGPAWRFATAVQRERFVAEFRRLLVRTYGHTLMDYRNSRIRYLPLLAPPDARRVTVRCEVEQPGGNPLQLAYAMDLTADGWKVYDVLVEGVSLVTNYRSSFAAIIQQQGMDGLIRRLAEKNGEGGA